MAIKGGDANYENGASSAARQASMQMPETGVVVVSDELKRMMGFTDAEWTGKAWSVRVPLQMPSGGVGDGG